MTHKNAERDRARLEIDDVDSEIVRLLAERMAAVERIGASKGGAQLAGA